MFSPRICTFDLNFLLILENEQLSRDFPGYLYFFVRNLYFQDILISCQKSILQPMNLKDLFSCFNEDLCLGVKYKRTYLYIKLCDKF